MLTEAEEDCLSTLHDLGAHDRFSRKNSAEITCRVRGPEADTAFQKAVLRSLTSRGLVRSERGRKGGYWLTPRGKRKFESVFKADTKPIMAIRSQ